MSTPALQIGDWWAHRERLHTHGHPVWQAEILQFGPPRSHKVRVRFIDGEYPGLDMWIPKIRLRVPWGEADAWLRDEGRTIAAWEASPVEEDSTEWWAATEIFGAYSEPNAIMMGWRGYERRLVRAEDIGKVACDLGWDVADLLGEPLAFVDRAGVCLGPWAVAEKLARRMAAVFAERVIAEVGEDERTWREGTRGGRYEGYGRRENYYSPEFCADWLRKRQPIDALVREWCGAEEAARFDEAAALRDEVKRLRGLVERAATQLQDSNHPHWSRALLKELGQGSDRS